ncbi:hypothetical protein [Nostoc sp.]|uniref:hypothetical protein n=1 Tax=Nostoc sp. TaxID=1180 RepID=UPI002FF6EB2A
MFLQNFRRYFQLCYAGENFRYMSNQVLTNSRLPVRSYLADDRKFLPGYVLHPLIQGRFCRKNLLVSLNRTIPGS